MGLRGRLHQRPSHVRAFRAQHRRSQHQTLWEWVEVFAKIHFTARTRCRICRISTIAKLTNKHQMTSLQLQTANQGIIFLANLSFKLRFANWLKPSAKKQIRHTRCRQTHHIHHGFIQRTLLHIHGHGHGRGGGISSWIDTKQRKLFAAYARLKTCLSSQQTVNLSENRRLSTSR